MMLLRLSRAEMAKCLESVSQSFTVSMLTVKPGDLNDAARVMTLYSRPSYNRVKLTWLFSDKTRHGETKFPTTQRLCRWEIAMLSLAKIFKTCCNHNKRLEAFLNKCSLLTMSMPLD